jgi:hypothetical protein
MRRSFFGQSCRAAAPGATAWAAVGNVFLFR